MPVSPFAFSPATPFYAVQSRNFFLVVVILSVLAPKSFRNMFLGRGEERTQISRRNSSVRRWLELRPSHLLLPRLNNKSSLLLARSNRVTRICRKRRKGRTSVGRLKRSLWLLRVRACWVNTYHVKETRKDIPSLSSQQLIHYKYYYADGQKLNENVSPPFFCKSGNQVVFSRTLFGIIIPFTH